MNKTAVIAGLIVIIVVIVVAAIVISGNRSAVASPTTTRPPATQQQNTSAPAGTTKPTTSTIPTTVPTTNTSAAQKPTISIETNQTYGTYLANASGYALYTYDSDVANSGNSTCYSACANAWPPFYPEKLILPQGLNASYFSTITRTGGGKQLTYEGKPLYLFVGDTKANTVTGNGIAGFAVAVIK